MTINQPEIKTPPIIDSLVIEEEPEPIVETETPEEEKVPETLEDFLPLALYFDNDEPDKRTRRNTTKKSYLQTFEPYIKRTEEFRNEYSGALSGEAKIAAETEIDQFFTKKSKKVKTTWNSFQIYC